MRAVSRLTGVSINTVTKLLEDIGLAAGLYQAQVMVDLPCKRGAVRLRFGRSATRKRRTWPPADKGVLGHGDVVHMDRAVR